MLQNDILTSFQWKLSCPSVKGGRLHFLACALASETTQLENEPVSTVPLLLTETLKRMEYDGGGEGL